MSGDRYKEWLELSQEEGSDGIEYMTAADHRRLDQLNEESGLTFMARYARESNASAAARGHAPYFSKSVARHGTVARTSARSSTRASSGSNYCRICAGPHKYKHGRA